MDFIELGQHSILIYKTQAICQSGEHVCSRGPGSLAGVCVPVSVHGLGHPSSHALRPLLSTTPFLYNLLQVSAHCLQKIAPIFSSMPFPSTKKLSFAIFLCPGRSLITPKCCYQKEVKYLTYIFELLSQSST